MNPTLKNMLITILGLIIGGVVNMTIIMMSSSIVPPPDGVDPSDMKSLAENMHRFQPQHFIMPFLAHAIGTLAGAFIAARYSASQHRTLAIVVGVFFLIGGITNIIMLPSPVWFTIVDLTLAYIPMAYLGWKLSGKPVK